VIFPALVYRPNLLWSVS